MPASIGLVREVRKPNPDGCCQRRDNGGDHRDSCPKPLSPNSSFYHESRYTPTQSYYTERVMGRHRENPRHHSNKLCPDVVALVGRLIERRDAQCTCGASQRSRSATLALHSPVVPDSWEAHEILEIDLDGEEGPVDGPTLSRMLRVVRRAGRRARRLFQRSHTERLAEIGG